MRYLPLTDADRQAMLAVTGAASIDDLFCDVPVAARRDGLVDLPVHQGEMAVERTINDMALKNLAASCAPFFLGAGAYRHHVPALADHLIQRGEFLTAYTPYQPEVAQGTLQYLFEFQTQVALLTAMEVANASLYDGPTAAAEAVLMASRITRRKRAVIAGNLHPHYGAVIDTQAKYIEFELDVAPAQPDGEDLDALAARLTKDTACVVVQNPDVFGHVRDLSELASACQDAGALLVVAVAEAVSFGAVRAPGDMGADIVVGEGQSLGGGLNFGGPYLGLMATRKKYVRQMPGRLVGQTTDVDGRRGWVLTLSTREQHIRREKATSNICTNSGLCALAFSIHLTMLGEAGLTQLAMLNHARACQTADRLAALSGVNVVNDSFFNEFTVRLPKPAAKVVDALAAKGVLGGVPASRLYPDQPEFEHLLLVTATETTDDAQIDALIAAMTEVL